MTLNILFTDTLMKLYRCKILHSFGTGHDKYFFLQPEPPICTFVFDQDHVNLDLIIHQENQKQIWPSGQSE